MDEKPKSPVLSVAKDTPGQRQGPLPVNPDQPWTDRNSGGFDPKGLKDANGNPIKKEKTK
jgi:hypothetical protein